MLDDNPRAEAAAAQVESGFNTLSAPTVALQANARGRGIQRKIAIDNASGKPANAPVGETNENIVKGYIATLCSDFVVSSGNVVPKTAAYCPAGASASSTPEACRLPLHDAYA